MAPVKGGIRPEKHAREKPGETARYDTGEGEQLAKQSQLAGKGIVQRDAAQSEAKQAPDPDQRRSRALAQRKYYAAEGDNDGRHLNELYQREHIWISNCLV